MSQRALFREIARGGGIVGELCDIGKLRVNKRMEYSFVSDFHSFGTLMSQNEGFICAAIQVFVIFTIHGTHKGYNGNNSHRVEDH